MSNFVGSSRLRYSIACAVGITPASNFGAYFPQPLYDPRFLMVPTNQYLKRAGVLDSWKAVRP